LEVLIDTIDESLWAVAVDNTTLQGVEVDPISEEVRWGTVYWAKVARIDKAMDAAFVNLDGENIGILHNADVRVLDKQGNYKKGGDKEIGAYLEPGQMIAVQAKAGYLPKNEDYYIDYPENKNPRVSMNIVLPGRYLLFAPFENSNRVSQRIRDQVLRKQLQEAIQSMTECKGCILRSAAANTQNDILMREARILELTWEQLQNYFKGSSPQLLMMGPGGAQRLLSDLANKQIERIEVSSQEYFEDALEWCEVFAPDLVTKVSINEASQDQSVLGLFEYRDLIEQIEDLFQPYVVLKRKGSLIIEHTAALTAIDVNRGADKRSNYEINCEAAHEIARQLRVRNLGGIIVVDFLKMKGKKEVDKLKKLLDDVFVIDDPCTVQVHGFTKLGLVELTRHRRTPALLERFQSAIS
jgi:Rne/Rng family ribonuclease